MAARSSALPRRRPTVEATRRRLLRAGRRAFARRGLAGANLRDDVLAPARVSVGSFYHQFEDKTQLLLEILREQAALAERARGEIRELPPARHLRELAERGLRGVLAVAEARPEVWRVQARERWSHDPRVRRFLAGERRRWRDWLCEEQRRAVGRSRARAQRERMAEYLLALGFATADARLERRRRGSPEPEIAALVRFAVAGATGGSGRARPRAPERRATGN